MVARLVRDQEVVGSSPVASTIRKSTWFSYVDFRYNRGVAQLVARSVRDAEVVGSNPVASTIFSGRAFVFSKCPSAIFLRNLKNAESKGLINSEKKCIIETVKFYLIFSVCKNIYAKIDRLK